MTPPTPAMIEAGARALAIASGDDPDEVVGSPDDLAWHACADDAKQCHAAMEAAFALIPQPDERRMTAERAVIDKVAAWANQRRYPPVDVEKVLLDELWNAYFALRCIGTPPDLVEDLLMAMRFDTNIKSASVCRAALALERERKGMKS